jgi:adhesin/invasin
VKQSRWAMSVWLLTCVLATLLLWFGCEQKGDMSPTGSSRRVLTFMDTVIVDPTVVRPQQTANVSARILNEAREPAVGENVRFSANRGTFGSARADTTVPTDQTGWARSQFRAPDDSGNVLLRAELLSMAEVRSAVIGVSSMPVREGLLTLWTEMDTLFADNGVSTTRVYARLRNDAHNPIAHATIYFSTTVGSITSPAVTDSLTGTAIATLVSTTEVGSAVITANYGTTSDSAHVMFLPPAAARIITVSSARASIVAGNDSTLITARVFDANNLPVVDNTVVNFATTLGLLHHFTSRTSHGVATTTLYASPAIGQAVVSATTGGNVNGSVSVPVLAGPVATVIVTADRDTLYADNASETTIHAFVTDNYGNAASEGTPVNFTAQGGTVTATSTVGSDGRAPAAFRAGLAVGLASVTAAAGNVQGSMVLQLVPTLPATINLAVSTPQLIANGSSQATLTATVADAQGRPVSDGTFVTFYAQRGTLSRPSQPMISEVGPQSKGTERSLWAKATTRAKKFTVNAVVADNGTSHLTSLYTATTVGGIATAMLTSATVAGADTVSVTANSLTDRRVVEYTAGPASSIQITPQSAQLPGDGVSSTLITCRVADAFGNHVPNGLAISAHATLGMLNPASGYTNNDGVFSTTLLSSRQSGTCAVTATVGDVNGYGEVLFTPPAVAAVTLSGDVASLLANGMSVATLTAVALDALGLPVAGATIIWQSDPGHGILVPVSQTTDSLGRSAAVFFPAASSTDAQQNVRASCNAHQASYPIHLIGVTVNAWMEVLTLPADGNSTTQVNAQVRETMSGLAVAGGEVHFAASSGSVEQRDTTNESGIASAVYRSAGEAGNVSITALYGDTLRAQTTLRLTGTEPDTVQVILSQNELLADGVSTATVTAVVTNEGGQAVANVPVTFAANGGGTCVPAIAVSDAQGRAIVTYYAIASTQDHQVDVAATIQRGDDRKALLLHGVTLTAQTSDVSLPANGSASAQIQVELRHSTSHVAISNATVQLGSTLGSVPASVTTDASGRATVSFVAGTQEGTAQIIARFGNLLTDTVRINLSAPSAASLNMGATRTSLLGSGADTSQVTCTVRDVLGVVLRNVQVLWSLQGQGTLLQSASITDSLGHANALFIAPASTGDVTATVSATVGLITQGMEIQSRGVTLGLSPAVSTIPANGAATTTINAQLRETTSSLMVSGANLHFGTSLGSIVGNATTNAAGVATVTLTAAPTAGTANIVGQYGNLLTANTQVTFYEQTAQQVVVVSDSAILHSDGVSSSLVRAYVMDMMSLPLAGVSVTWSAQYGTMNIVQTMTDQNGVATVTYIATASSEAQRAVHISAAAGSAQGSTIITERGVTVNVTAEPAIVIADGNSTSAIHAHIYETLNSIALSNVNVSFGTTLGTIANSARTNASGVATVTLTSSTQTGTAQITAGYGNGLTAQVPVAFVPSTPHTLSLSVSPRVLLADNISQAQVTAVVTDQNGNPVPNGTQVRFSVPPQSGSLENLRSTVNGSAGNTLTSSTTPDTVIVLAWSEANPSARDSVEVIYTVGAAARVMLSAQRDTVNANGMEVDSISAHVTDAVGHALSNVEVLFATSIGNITASRVTDNLGNAHVAFSSSRTGNALITATAGSVQGNYTLYLIPGTPWSITLDYSPSSVGIRGSGRNETLLITATVRDVNNNIVLDGTPVFFSIALSPDPQNDALSTYNAVPTINGHATVSFSSGFISGTARIRATCEGRTAVSTEILVYSGPPYIEDINAGCETSHMTVSASPCNMFGMDVAGDSVQIIAIVGDRYNNPVTPGTAVYFTTSAGVVVPSMGYTDSSGFAHVTLYSAQPRPTIERWLNGQLTEDPNRFNARWTHGDPVIRCSAQPTQDGVAKVVASSAGVDASGDSVWVWAATDVTFNYRSTYMQIRSVTVNGDPNRRTLYIGQSAVIRIAVFDPDYWPAVAGSVLQCTANHGNTYPSQITVGCPGDTSFTFSFFNNLTQTDDDAASPVLITLDTRYGDSYVFTETFTLLASLPPSP